MDFVNRSQKFCRRAAAIGNHMLRLLLFIVHMIVSVWYSMRAMVYAFESYCISFGVLRKYKSLNLAKLQYLAIVVDSEDAHQTSKIVKILKWLDSIGIKNVCLYDMNGVLKKCKETILKKLKNAKSIEEVNEAGTHHDPNQMTLEFVSHADGKEAVVKAANLIFVETVKHQNFAGENGGQILSESRLNEALQAVGRRCPEPDLLLVYGPVRSHLGFPAWGLRYTEIVHLGPLNSMRYGSLIKAIFNYTKVRQNYGK